MKKMKSVRCAVGLVIATLLTTCLIGGTFARYTTSAMAADSARVAYWGFSSSNSISLNNLFSSEYTNVLSRDGSDVIAPGTEGSASFAFIFEGNGTAEAPEVAYTFSVDVTGYCDALIAENPNIQFKLDNGSYGTWTELLNSLKALAGNASGSKVYSPGELPTAFRTGTSTHTISWKWIFTDTIDAAGQDAEDTAMGNSMDPVVCSLTLSVSAVQVD